MGVALCCIMGSERFKFTVFSMHREARSIFNFLEMGHRSITQERFNLLRGICSVIHLVCRRDRKFYKCFSFIKKGYSLFFELEEIL